MFAGFNLELLKNSDGNDIEFSKYSKRGEEHLKGQNEKYKKKLEDFIIEGTTDGTKLQSEWFPEIKADIFISHSHKDIELANGLAGWLNSKFNLKCFVDSNVWKNIDELLQKINNKYSEKRPFGNSGMLYNYEKSNKASQHVNIMLSIALQKMIDKTEAIFVLNTDKCIKKYGDVYETETYSPWIYTEIISTELMRKKSLSKYREKAILEHSDKNICNFSKSEYKSAYNISLDHLVNVDMSTLTKWSNSKIEDYPLDKLYKILKVL